MSRIAGFRHSEETRDKIRAALTGKRWSPERLAKHVSARRFIANLVNRTRNLEGQTFGHLHPVCIARRDRQGRLMWFCRCDCGFLTVVASRHLVNGKTISCGCYAATLGPANGRRGAWKHSGSRCHLYKPTLTNEERLRGRNLVEVRQWRVVVFNRDNYTCHACGTRGGKLRAHHLDSWQNHTARRTDVSNGITLCQHCHDSFHLYMGGPRTPCVTSDYYSWKSRIALKSKPEA